MYIALFCGNTWVGEMTENMDCTTFQNAKGYEMWVCHSRHVPNATCLKSIRHAFGLELRRSSACSNKNAGAVFKKKVQQFSAREM
jgi:hypothetical protein